MFLSCQYYVSTMSYVGTRAAESESRPELELVALPGVGVGIIGNILPTPTPARSRRLPTVNSQ